MGKGLFDLETRYAFYGVYHTNPINILIHTVFIWPIFYTLLILLHFTPPFFHLLNLNINLGFVLAFFYTTFYIFVDKKAGFLAAFLCLLCWASSGSLASQLGYSLAWKVVLVAQLICWTVLGVGHGMFEEQVPSILDDLSQSSLMVLYFVLLEVLQSYFGYEPYPGFNARVSAKIEANRKEWKASKDKKAS